MRLLFDIETDGLLDTLTKTHCVVTKNPDTGQRESFRPTEIAQALHRLSSASSIIAHNAYGFDEKAIKKLYPEVELPKVIDTLPIARLIWSNINEWDFKAARVGKMPQALIGSHSLKAWGYRLGVLKGDFGETTDWSEYTEEMLSYCEQDVEVLGALWEKIEATEYSETAIELELSVARLMAQQETNGFCFNTKAATELYQKLTVEKVQIKHELIKLYSDWWESAGTTVPKRSTAERTEGAEYTRLKRVQFNPSSRQHIAKRLKAKYGWETKEFTPSGEPKIDETVLGKLEYPEAVLMNQYLILTKFLGQLNDGKGAWLQYEKGGKIHGRVNPNGAVTGRATHMAPNMGQVPSVRHSKEGVLLGNAGHYGWEARSLFGVPEGWWLLGSDASGLELRCLAHFMAPYDGGEYAELVITGDVHTANQKAAGLPTRNNAKTFIYAFLKF